MALNHNKGLLSEVNQVGRILWQWINKRVNERST